MYVCICNALRDRDIARAAQAGATTVDQAYAALGCKTACGQCCDEAKTLIANAAANAPNAYGIAAE